MPETHQEPTNNAMPRAPQLLGYAGLIPFIGLSLASIMFEGEGAQVAVIGLNLYAAVILSFLGGLHWGRIAARADAFEGGAASQSATAWLIWSVMPSLWAWGVLWMLPNAAYQSVLLGLGILVCWLVDRRAITSGLFASWMGRLRRDLSLTAIISLCLPAMFAG